MQTSHEEQNQCDDNRVETSGYNLYTMPSQTVFPKRGDCITFGDMHGNTLLMIHALCRVGAIVNMTEKRYQKLVVCYTKMTQDLRLDDLLLYGKLIQKLRFNKDIFLRFLGDDLADRGGSEELESYGLDWFTLRLFKAIHDQRIQYEIILSNHAIEFLVNVERLSDDEDPVFALWQVHPEHPEMAASMLNMNILLDKKYISFQEIKFLSDKYYTPFLKMIGYNYDNKTIQFFSHAPNGLREFIDVGWHLGLPISKHLAMKTQAISDVRVLLDYIDDTNAALQKIIHQEQLALYFRWTYGAPHEFLWNRVINQLDTPAFLNDVKLVFFHGHDHNPHVQWNVFSLDSLFGKFPYYFYEGKESIEKLQVLIAYQPEFNVKNNKRKDDEIVSLVMASDPVMQPREALALEDPFFDVLDFFEDIDLNDAPVEDDKDARSPEELVLMEEEKIKHPGLLTQNAYSIFHINTSNTRDVDDISSLKKN